MARRAESDSDQDQIYALPGVLYISQQQWKDEHIDPNCDTRLAPDCRRTAGD